MHIFEEIHSNLPREAPGSAESTRKALSFVSGLAAAPWILDVGCGPGAQTIQVVRATGGHVVAIDIHQPFLDVLSERARSEGVAARVEARNESMFTMSFGDAAFDLIWSEGAIYIFGFERGLVEWRHFLKPAGFFAVSELSWRAKARPSEAVKFWEEGYPGMKSIEENLETIERLEYTLVGHFTLPENDWWDSYYHPLETRIGELKQKYARFSATLEELSVEEHEIELFRKHSDSYGYEFFVLRN